MVSFVRTRREKSEIETGESLANLQRHKEVSPPNSILNTFIIPTGFCCCQTDFTNLVVLHLLRYCMILSVRRLCGWYVVLVLGDDSRLLRGWQRKWDCKTNEKYQQMSIPRCCHKKFLVIPFCCPVSISCSSHQSSEEKKKKHKQNAKVTVGSSQRKP